MSDRRKLKPEGKKAPDFLVTLQIACTVKIYGTTDADEAKTRAVNRIRGLFDGIDADLYIPRVLVIGGDVSPEELKAQLESQIKPKERP